MRRSTLTLACLWLAACSQPAPSSATREAPPRPAVRPETPEPTPAASAAAVVPPPRLSGPAVLDVVLPGSRYPAIIRVPVGATTKRPVIIAAHGWGDRPDWQCEVAMLHARHSAFVLCPTGDREPTYSLPGEDHFAYSGAHQLRALIKGGLAELVRRYSDWVDLRDVTLAGFSSGAWLGVSVVLDLPSIKRVLVTEGGDNWDVGRARAFAKQGGTRVMFACGTDACAKRSAAARKNLESLGVATRLVHSVGAGHTYGGAVHTDSNLAFGWLIEGAASWESPESDTAQ